MKVLPVILELKDPKGRKFEKIHLELISENREEREALQQMDVKIQKKSSACSIGCEEWREMTAMRIEFGFE